MMRMMKPGVLLLLWSCLPPTVVASPTKPLLAPLQRPAATKPSSTVPTKPSATSPITGPTIKAPVKQPPSKPMTPTKKPLPTKPVTTTRKPTSSYDDTVVNQTKATPWHNGGKGGLTLSVINSLDAKWKTEFKKSIYQWDHGNPDALSLLVTTGSSNHSCTLFQGKLNVCNDNYGDIQWLGINERLTQNGWLIGSAARLNDYYLDTAIPSLGQYTMCHNLGHGFGLNHTDEKFYNTDLGNCLDYTVHPWLNDHPSAMNFKLLSKLYGTVATRRERRAGLLHEEVVLEDMTHPDWVVPSFSEAVQRLREVGHEHAEALGWNIVHKSPYSEIHTLHLGGDYSAQVHILLASHP